MNEDKTKDLMIHVERIVRPIRATAGRKLRLRLELMGHLQSALEEERRKFGGDESAALENAKRRLGEEPELKRQLQRSVPLWQRALLFKVPVSRAVEKWEYEASMAMRGQREEMTFAHVLVLYVLAILIAGNPFYVQIATPRVAATWGSSPLMSVLVVVVSVWVILLACIRLLFSAAKPNAKLNWRDALGRSAMIVAMEIGLLCLITERVMDGLPTFRQVAFCAGYALGAMAISIFIARRISVLRRVYDEWLNLEIAL